MLRGLKRLRAPVLAAMLFAGASLQASGQAPPPQPAATPAAAPLAPVAAPLTPADANAWLDGFMPGALVDADIVGAVVTVVKDGQIVASRGYGYSDLATRAPVDPASTLFRPGSISKLFTWTAVMQLVEQGKIDLDADINQYIDFAIPAYNGAPITMRNIMTHTSGFQEVVHDLISEDDAQHTPAIPLDQYLRENIPARIYAPGSMPAYSNYATALAGYVIQRVSGEEFSAYIQHHIFDPLGMQHSSFVQPLPEAMRPHMSGGYKNGLDGEAQPFELVIPAPAGSASVTGNDMALFMAAHLNNGAGLLRPETARMMHETIDHHFPGVDSMALGFYQEGLNGQRIISHGGDTNWFHSDLALLMDQHVGVFVSFNSGGSGSPSATLLRWRLMQSFMDRYYPVAHADTPEPLATAREHGAAIVGVYESARRAENNPLLLAYYLGQTTVTMLPNGDLVGPGLPLPNGAKRHWREVEPWVWQEVGGHYRLGANVENGRVVAFGVEPLSFAIPFMRAPAQRSSDWLTPAISAALLVLILTLLSWPIRAIVRRVHKTPFPYDGARATAHRIGGAAALALVAYLVAWVGFVLYLMETLASTRGDVMTAPLLTLYVAGVIPVAAFAGVGYANFNLWRAQSTWFAKVWGALLLLSVGVVLWFAVVMNLFSFHTRY